MLGLFLNKYVITGIVAFGLILATYFSFLGYRSAVNKVHALEAELEGISQSVERQKLATDELLITLKKNNEIYNGIIFDADSLKPVTESDGAGVCLSTDAIRMLNKIK